MELDKDSAAIVRWLQAQPHGATVFWTSDHFSSEYPWCGTWADIILPDMLEEVGGMNWMFTIVHPDDEDIPDDVKQWEFTYPTDLKAWGVYNPGPPEYWYIEEILLADDEALTPEQEEHLNSVLARLEETYRDSKYKVPRRSVRGVWSSAQVSNALSWWATKYAERPDLHFVWNPDGEVSEFVKKAEEMIGRIESGEEPVYEVGTTKSGLKVKMSGEAMDFFLNRMIEEETDNG